jgi:hypothetical protein
MLGREDAEHLWAGIAGDERGLIDVVGHAEDGKGKRGNGKWLEADLGLKRRGQWVRLEIRANGFEPPDPHYSNGNGVFGPVCVGWNGFVRAEKTLHEAMEGSDALYSILSYGEYSEGRTKVK